MITTGRLQNIARLMQIVGDLAAVQNALSVLPADQRERLRGHVDWVAAYDRGAYLRRVNQHAPR